MENLDNILIGYDYETQKEIRRLYALDKLQLVLYILNLENS